MQTSTISLFFTCATCCLYATLAYPLETLDGLDPEKLERDLAAADPDNMSPTDLRKLLLKKLRFREIVSDDMMSPEEIIEAQKGLESEERHGHHKASKRHKMDDLMTRVRALLSGIKERQIKQSMELPSLRFGRSGFNVQHY